MAMKEIPSQRLRLLKRHLWWLPVIVAIVAGNWWWRQPAAMHVVTTLYFDRNHDFTCSTPLGLCCWHWSAQANGASTITQYDWDGKPRWSVRAPAGIAELNWHQMDMDCSPDGHVVAVCIIADRRVHVLAGAMAVFWEKSTCRRKR